MGKFAIILWSAVTIGCLYVAATLILFFRLKKRLMNADLQTFKAELGKNYLYKLQLTGYTKYKWSLGLMTVRAVFDEAGNLAKIEIRPSQFFPLLFSKTFSTEL